MSTTLALQCTLLLFAIGQTKQTPEDALFEVGKNELRVLDKADDVLDAVKDEAGTAKGVAGLKALRKEALDVWAAREKLDVAKAPKPSVKQQDLDGWIQDARHTIGAEAQRTVSLKGGVELRSEIQAFMLALERGCDSKEVLPWHWSDEKATLAYSTTQHLPDFDVQLESDKEFYRFIITIRSKADPRIKFSSGESRSELFQGHEATVFTRSKDKLYIANFSPISTGCAVTALDLKTGKTLWQKRLFGTGPTPLFHTQYLNTINIETDGKRIFVYGKESDGRYVEFLDIDTGKTLANQRFEGGMAD